MTVTRHARTDDGLPLAGLVPLSALAGAAFGTGTVLLNHSDHGALRGLAAVVGAASGWAAAGVLVGWCALRLMQPAWRTALLCTVFLACASVAYFVADHLFALAAYTPVPVGVRLPPGGTEAGPPGFHTSETIFWVAVSLVCGPACAGVAWLARRPGIPGLLGGLCVPAGMALWSGLLLTNRFEFPRGLPVWAAHWTVIAVCVVGAGVLVARRVAAVRPRLAG